MISEVQFDEVLGLDEYATYAYLSGMVHELRAEASVLVPKLAGRRVFMLNSTARGGGVAEMLPRVVSLLSELGVETHWLVMEPERTEFFSLTKRLHNLIHGVGRPVLEAADARLYETVSRDVADALVPWFREGDLLVVHDPQPAGAGALVKNRLGIPVIWRCHIGLDEHTPQTREAWRFLQPHLEPYDHFVFTAAEYFPDFVVHRASTIHPALDPLSDKNRELHTHKVVGVLCNAGLCQQTQPVLGDSYSEQAKRMQPDGDFGPAADGADIGLLHRPIVTQISRWDRLKGFAPLLEGFSRLKRNAREDGNGTDPVQRRRLELVRLVLAGPDPSSIQDDPEGKEVLDELRSAYMALDPQLQQDVAFISLPMESRRENALMVNALQRCSSLVVQNSLQEGFGLTATEAMWKRIAVLGTQAVGLRMQIREGLDGRLVQDANAPDEVAEKLGQMLADPVSRDLWGRSAQRRAFAQFSVFTQVARWLRVLTGCVDPPGDHC
jgi:trehalose synthase